MGVFADAVEVGRGDRYHVVSSGVLPRNRVATVVVNVRFEYGKIDISLVESSSVDDSVWTCCSWGICCIRSVQGFAIL